MADRRAALRIALAGRRAAACLHALAADGGSVLAVFRRTVYLCHDRSGEIVCVGPSSLGAGPLNALAAPASDRGLPDWQDAGLAPGDPAIPQGGGIAIGAAGALAYSGARLHDPPRGPLAWDRAGLAAAFAHLSAALAPFDLGEGLAPFADPARRAPPPASPTVRRAGPAVAALESWLAAAAGAPPQDAVEALVGLGPGLTPSGDDFLGGMAIALSMSGRAGAAAALAGPVLSAAAHATNRISAAHLWAAADGLGADALHRAIDALARGGGAALADALRGLESIGHSSGWDALAGAVSSLAGIERRLAAQPARSAAAVSAAPAADSATTTPESRSAWT